MTGHILRKLCTAVMALVGIGIVVFITIMISDLPVWILLPGLVFVIICGLIGEVAGNALELHLNKSRLR